jgi:signal peptidase I
LWSSQDYITGLPDPPPYVERELLIGRALGVYWPHGWRLGTDRIGFIPNFQRIGLIR